MFFNGHISFNGASFTWLQVFMCFYLYFSFLIQTNTSELRSALIVPLWSSGAMTCKIERLRDKYKMAATRWEVKQQLIVFVKEQLMSWWQLFSGQVVTRSSAVCWPGGLLWRYPSHLP